MDLAPLSAAPVSERVLAFAALVRRAEGRWESALPALLTTCRTARRNKDTEKRRNKKQRRTEP